MTGAGRPPPPGSLAIAVRDETLLLHPDRALSWPARRTLVVADIHFGKDDVFRRAGLAIPAGAAQEDLVRLERLLAATASERLLVLGDFVHGAVVDGDGFPGQFAPWRARHRELAIEVVAGNHDRPARRAGIDWATTVCWHDAALHEGPFGFVHAAEPAAAGRGGDEAGARRSRTPGEPPPRPGPYTLSGHVHPVARLPVPGGRMLRVPVFWRRAESLVLPSFGRLTGGHVVRAAAGEQLIVAGPERLHVLAARATPAQGPMSG